MINEHLYCVMMFWVLGDDKERLEKNFIYATGK